MKNPYRQKTKRVRNVEEVENTGYVSEDADTISPNEGDLENKIQALSEIMNRMDLRLRNMENRKALSHGSTSFTPNPKQFFPKSNSQCVSKQAIPLTDRYIMFTKGKLNPNGGIYTMDHLTQVLIKDEMVEGLLVDETRCFYRVRVNGEVYPPGLDGRLKAKHQIKDIRGT